MPARPPAAPGAELFEILAPPSAPKPGLPARLPEASPFEILAPEPVLPPPRPMTPVEAFFRRGPEAPAPTPPPPCPRAPEELREPGLVEAFLDPMDIERERRGIPSREYIDQILDLGELRRMARAGRRDPDFQREVRNTLRGGPPAVLPLVRIAEEERGAEDKVADFLGIPRTEIGRIEKGGRDPWAEILNPGLYAIERGLDWYLGDEVPGTFHFGINDRGEFGLMYLEEHPEL